MDSLEEFVNRQSQGGVESAVAALRDPNSSVWKPNAYGDPRTSAAALAWSLGNNHALDPSQSAQAMQMAGFDGSAVQQAGQSIVGQQQASSGSWNTGLGSQFKEFIKPPALMALAALTANTLGPAAAAAGAEGGGATLGSASAGATGATATGVGASGVPTVAGLAEGASPYTSTLAGLEGSGAMMPAAVPETAGQLSQWGLTESAPGVFTPAAATAGTGLWQSLKDVPGSRDVLGTGLMADLARGLPGLFGAYASGRQADALGGLANQYMNVGAPSRARYEASYQPGFTMANDPGYTDALNQSAKATLHGLSVSGNPADSPNAWAQSLSDMNAKFAYPALQDYRRTNAGTGGLAALTSAAPAAASGAIGAQGNVYNSLGGAAADIFSPPRRLEDLLRGMRMY